jgi:mRNA interferase MazF
MKRGDVYSANLSPRSGSEQKGTRPVIILSNDGFNLAPGWRSIIVVPVSSSAKQATRGPTVVDLAKGTAGLFVESIALCHQITTLDRSKLSRKLGTLPPGPLADVEAGVRAALDL